MEVGNAVRVGDGGTVNMNVAVGDNGVEVSAWVGTSVWLAVGVSVPKIRTTITLGVIVGTLGTHSTSSGVMIILKRQFAR